MRKETLYKQLYTKDAKWGEVLPTNPDLESKFCRDDQEFGCSLQSLLLVSYRMAVPISDPIPNPSWTSKSVWILPQDQVHTHYAPK